MHKKNQITLLSRTLYTRWCRDFSHKYDRVVSLGRIKKFVIACHGLRRLTHVEKQTAMAQMCTYKAFSFRASFSTRLANVLIVQKPDANHHFLF
jgi:hypothetical protein